MDNSSASSPPSNCEVLDKVDATLDRDAKTCMDKVAPQENGVLALYPGRDAEVEIQMYSGTISSGAIEMRSGGNGRSMLLRDDAMDRANYLESVLDIQTRGSE